MADYDVVVIGGGPGGYVAAIRAGQLGLRAAVVEREAVGGVCLNWGCIPTKALLHCADLLNMLQHADALGISFDNLRHDYGQATARSRKIVDRFVKGVEFLLKKNKVELVRGDGYIAGPGEVRLRNDSRILRTGNVIIATGASARSLPGIAVDGHTVITSREAVVLAEVPKRAVVIGAGAIGVEFAHLWRSYGSEVTMLEMLPHILPLEDEEISQVLEKSFTSRGIKLYTGARVEKLEIRDDSAKIIASTARGEVQVEGDKVLIAVGVAGNSGGIGLEEEGVVIERSFIEIDERMATNVSGVYAVGDVTGPPLLAHVASAQGVAAAEAIAGRQPAKLVYHNMPRATYCHPQVASLGLTEAEAISRGHNVKVGKFPFRANGRAMTMEETGGLVKVIADAKYGDLLGVHMIGPEVSELLGELSLATKLESTNLEIGRSVHPHPSLSEALMEAALAVDGEAIHI
ncbi:MAG: dihydrolipoyl dehydrogenase [Chloroflexi bacterium]|nr:dihydrolipoyl dehydrogenase [Chloroflexota bacterium]